MDCDLTDINSVKILFNYVKQPGDINLCANNTTLVLLINFYEEQINGQATVIRMVTKITWSAQCSQSPWALGRLGPSRLGLSLGMCPNG